MKISKIKYPISKKLSFPFGNWKFDIGNSQGSILIYCIVIIFIFSLVMVGLLQYSAIQLRTTRATVSREQAFQVAEAGVNYYQWHLAHFPNDFWDGNASSTPGPYVHNFVDSDTGQTVGQFSLDITPPPVGSTMTVIKSTGSSVTNPNAKRFITVRYGIPSLAQYAFLANSSVWVGASENVSGQYFSNGGIHFEGTTNAPVISAKTTYTCGYMDGCSPNATKPGIWGVASAQTQSYWQFPAPNIDFSSITANLATMKSSAQTAGIYLPPSNAQGYSLVFKSNGTLDIYKVTTLLNEPAGYDVKFVTQNTSVDYNARTLLGNYAIPANGIIYIEDKVWVEGTVKGRAMVAAAVLPYNYASSPNIMVANSIVYAAKDGTNSLGLLAQKHLLVTYNSADNLEIDAAMIAQNGSAQRYGWDGNIKNSITIYGAIASNEYYGGWTWWCGFDSSCVISGYRNTITTYDANLLYAPPPSFPLTSNGYQQISWGSN